MRDSFSADRPCRARRRRGVRSGSQSPMSQSCETTRVPGASARRRGRSCRLTAGSRYIVTTVARPRSVANRSCSRNSTRSCTPAARASSRLFFTSSGTISTPRPRAPKRRAAVMTMRPSPEPRSITWSAGPTAASSSIASVTWSGVVMKGTSSWAHGAPARHRTAAIAPARRRPTPGSTGLPSCHCRRSADHGRIDDLELARARRQLGDDGGVADDEDAVAERQQLLQVRRDQDDRHALLRSASITA